MADVDDWAQSVDDQEQKLTDELIKVKLQGTNNSTEKSSMGDAPIVHPIAGLGRGRSLHGASMSNVTPGVSAPAPSYGAGDFRARPTASNVTSVPVVPTVVPPAVIPPVVVSPVVTADSGANVETGNDESGCSLADASLVNKLIRSRLINSKSDIEVLRSDPKSPLYHVKNFNELHLKPNLMKGLYEMGFNAPSKIQESALPALLCDPPANMIAQSQSGTGKTAAFVVTMLTRVNPEERYPQCLCLAPTYELALQIGEVTKKMAQFMPNISICYAIRGETGDLSTQIQDQIVIGTPGTMLDWCLRFKRIDLKKVNCFVLDEADVMIDTQGHKDQSVRIQRGLRKDCQMLLFSATYNDEVMNFANAIIVNPIVIRLRREEESLDNVQQYYIECNDLNDKFMALANIYESITVAQAMIFCHTKRTASWLTGKMKGLGNSVALLTGELSVEQRAAIIDRFRAGKEKLLITTNLSARGIDVDQVTVVVNFDLPVDQQTRQVDCETYLHRIGRTGRFGKNGLAINMIDSQMSKRMMEDIEKHFGRKIVKLDPNNFEEMEKIGTNQS